MERNYDIFFEELKLSCYQPQVTARLSAAGCCKHAVGLRSR